MFSKKISTFIGLALLTTLSYSSSAVINTNSLVLKDKYTLESTTNLSNSIPAIDKDGNINIVVEIPAGTNEKWEVNPETGNLEWEIRNEKPRIVQYLPYVGNYGMVPQTLTGDGDTIDVLLLGDAIARGEVKKGRVIGVVKMIDKGEQDDKLIAIGENSVFSEIKTLDEFNNKFPGITDIIKIWFANYKGPNGKVEITGVGNEIEAMKMLDESMKNFKK